MTKKKTYDNDSISSLKGADRVRKRPGVIFGSDGLEGCEHAVFEILSNAIDEARAGLWPADHRDPLCRSLHSRWRIRAVAVPWTGTRRRGATTGSWCSASCTPEASTTTKTATTTSTRWGSTVWAPAPPSTPADYMDVTVCRDGKEYRLHFERGEIAGETAGDGAQAPQTDRLHHPLAAGSGGVHRHRHPGGLLPGGTASGRPWSTPGSPSACGDEVAPGKFETDGFPL